MTLILVLANQQQVVLLSDRRVTSGGKVVKIENEPKDESNKAAVFVCKNARLAVAYTGLAKAGESFVTRQWLLKALMESAAPDFLMGPTIERFRARASRDFASISMGTSSEKRLTVVLAGYCYDDTPPRCYCWLVSNFEGLDDNQSPPRKEPSDEFSVQYARDRRPTAEEFNLLLVAGAKKAVRDGDFESLRTLLLQNKPVQALVGKGVEVLRTAAKSDPKQRIGKQCTSIVLPSNPDEYAIGEYHSAKLTHQIYSPSLISALGDGSGVYAIADPLTEARDADDQPRPTWVPKVGGNWPCPCGSGLKYRKCHGRSRQN